MYYWAYLISGNILSFVTPRDRELLSYWDSRERKIKSPHLHIASIKATDGRATHGALDFPVTWDQFYRDMSVKLTSIGPDNDFSAPSHYIKQCWNIVNSNLRNKLKWNPERNYTFSPKKMHLKMSSVKWRQFCLGFSVLKLIHGNEMGSWRQYMAYYC